MGWKLLNLLDDVWHGKDENSIFVLALLDLWIRWEVWGNWWHGIVLVHLLPSGMIPVNDDWWGEALSFASTIWGTIGLVFFPLLFIIYMSPPAEFIYCHGVRYDQYTDDTQLYVWSLWSRWGTTAEPWQDRVALLLEAQWFRIMPSLVLARIVLPQRDPVHNLEVLLNSRLLLRGHLWLGEPLYSSDLCASWAHWIISPTHVLVTSRLNYWNVLYMGLPFQNIQKLQLICDVCS